MNTSAPRIRPQSTEPVLEILVDERPMPSTRTAPTRTGLSFSFTCRSCGSSGFSADFVARCPACRKPLMS
jgi:hypothetical protein